MVRAGQFRLPVQAPLFPLDTNLMQSKTPPFAYGTRRLKCPGSRTPIPISLGSVRPSLLDTRFRGDAWIVAGEDGLMSLFLENSCLVRLRLLSFDVATLNGALQQMR